jgi:hypothetical protein
MSDGVTNCDDLCLLVKDSLSLTIAAFLLLHLAHVFNESFDIGGFDEL